MSGPAGPSTSPVKGRGGMPPARPRVKKEVSLFIPKKPKNQAVVDTVRLGIRSQQAEPVPPPVRRPEEEDVKPHFSGVEGVDYIEYKLVSSSQSDWTYDVMKLESRSKVDLSVWPLPIQLNRKEPKPRPGQEDDVEMADGTGVEEMEMLLGQDGKPVYGPDGKIVMVPVGTDANGLGRIPASLALNGKQKGPAEPKKTGWGKKRKTRQVFLQSEDTRKFKREERYPWLLEDQTGEQSWVGRVENADKYLSHGLFVLGQGNTFQFVPAHRWYRFKKRPSYRTLSYEEAEKEFEKIQKNKDPGRWLMHTRAAAANGDSGSSPAAHPVAQRMAFLVKKEENEKARASLGDGAVVSIGGRRLKVADKGDSTNALFGDDEEEIQGTRNSRIKKEIGGEGDYEEIEFEDDFADDEEVAVGDQNGIEADDAKELEERIKKEYRRDGSAMDDDDEPGTQGKLTGAGRETKKLLKRIKKMGVQEDDDETDDDEEDKDPYASSQDSDAEEEERREKEREEQEREAAKAKAKAESDAADAFIAERRSASVNPSGTNTPTKKTVPSSNPPSRAGSPLTGQSLAVPSQTPRGASPSSANVSRAASPVPSQPGAGNAVVAKRATSPKRPKPATTSSSVVASRATSPAATAKSPAAPGTSSTPRPPKRKADGDSGAPTPGPPTPSASSPAAAAASPAATGDGSAPPKKKVKKQREPSPEPYEGMLPEAELIAWLRQFPDGVDGVSSFTKQFKAYLRDERDKKMLVHLIRKVGVQKGPEGAKRIMLRAGL